MKISGAVEQRQAAIKNALEEHKKAADAEMGFKEEHARCVTELSLREGLGQRCRLGSRV